MNLTTVAVLGDIHTEDALLEQALAFVRPRVDTIFAVGDIVDGFGDVNRCCDLLRTNDVQVVRGNHERWLLDEEMRILNDANQRADLRSDLIAWLNELPTTITFETQDGPLLLCHGLGEDDMARLLPDDSGYSIQSNAPLEKLICEMNVRYVICGHTHQRMVRRIDNVTFLNAGTLKQQQEPCFFIADFIKREVQFFDMVAGRIEPAAVISLA